MGFRKDMFDLRGFESWFEGLSRERVFVFFWGNRLYVCRFFEEEGEVLFFFS